MTYAIMVVSGIGGLATAIRHTFQGFRVDVNESSDRAGNKISELNLDGFRFDAIPLLLTLSEMVLELLNDVLCFPIRKLKIITKYFYPDRTQVSACTDIQKLSEQIQKKLKVPANRVIDFLQKAATVWDLISGLFIFSSFNGIKNLMRLKSLTILLNHRFFHPFCLT